MNFFLCCFLPPPSLLLLLLLLLLMLLLLFLLLHDFGELDASIYIHRYCFTRFSDECIFTSNKNAHRTAIFIPISERFFLSSHTGLWRLCRYALAPILLTNSTLPQLLTKLIVTDGNEINRLKNDIATQPYIKEWRNLSVPIKNVTSIDNRFKQALFANWILDPKSQDFTTIKTKYKSLTNPSNTSNIAGGGGGKHKKVTYFVISSHNLTMVKDLFGLTPINVQVNETRRATVFVPKNIQLALFDEWPQKERVVSLLGQFAKDMELPTIIKSANGSQLVLRPPDPPSSKGQTNPDYHYTKYGMQSMLSLGFKKSFLVFENNSKQTVWLHLNHIINMLQTQRIERILTQKKCPLNPTKNKTKFQIISEIFFRYESVKLEFSFIMVCSAYFPKNNRFKLGYAICVTVCGTATWLEYLKYQ